MISAARRLRRLAVFVAAAILVPLPAFAGEPHGGDEAVAAAHEEHAEHDEKGGHHSSELTDEYIPLQLEGFPERPRYLLELGNPYLGTGRIKPGIQLPTGAVCLASH